MAEKNLAPTGKTKAQVFRERLLSTLILWVIVSGVFVSMNPWAFFGLVLFLTGAGALEFRAMLAGQPGNGCRTIGTGIGILVVSFVGFHFCQLESMGLPAGLEILEKDGSSFERSVSHHSYWMGYDAEIFGLCLTVLAAFCWRFRVGIIGRESVNAVGDALMAYVYVPILFGIFTLRLIFLPSVEGIASGAWILLLMIAAAKFTDMGAYITGSLIGKHKMAPKLSPAKTWEGFGGALIFAQIAAWSVWLLAGETLAWLAPLHVGILALLIGLVAIAGDLAESIVKRSLGVKDSGNWMPGIGGILDLIDSLAFAAPVTYFYLQFFVLNHG